MSTDPVLAVDDYAVHLRSARGVVRAVDGVSLTIHRGQTVGLVGESGSGKSVFSRSLLGLIPASAIAHRAGSIRFDGRELIGTPESRLRRIRGRRIAMVFQDASTSLSPVMRIGEQIAGPMRRHLGLGRRAAAARTVELLDQVGIADPRRRAGEYPVQLSGGMRQRVMIAIALSCEPEVIVADEPTTALDVTVQGQILDLLDQLRHEHNLAVLLVSHDLGVIAGRVDEVAVMYAGRIVEHGSTHAVFTDPRMPYTVGLLSSVPTLRGPRQEQLVAIPGSPPDLTALPAGCPFAPRCSSADETCARSRPELRPDPRDTHSASRTHLHACWHPARATRVAGTSVGQQ